MWKKLKWPKVFEGRIEIVEMAAGFLWLDDGNVEMARGFNEEDAEFGGMRGNGGAVAMPWWFRVV